MKIICYQLNMNWINLICIGFFIVCVFFTTQETFANGVVENFSEEFFFEEEIFTEVNKKLVNEIHHEIQKGNIDEVIALTRDLKENKEKLFTKLIGF